MVALLTRRFAYYASIMPLCSMLFKMPIIPKLMRACLIMHCLSLVIMCHMHGHVSYDHMPHVWAHDYMRSLGKAAHLLYSIP